MDRPIKFGDRGRLIRVSDGHELCVVEFFEKPVMTISGDEPYIWRLKVLSGLDQKYISIVGWTEDHHARLEGFEGEYRFMLD